MSGEATLGIHSTVDPRTEGSFNQLVDGHAWITVTRNGQTKHYGLWPDAHSRVQDNGPGTDIREGMEALLRPTASRYYALTPEQERRLDQALSENVAWSYTNTCASWATTTLTKVTGQQLDAGELMLTDTPRELIESIRRAERLQPTGPAHPQPATEEHHRASSEGSMSDLSRSLHHQAIEGVHRVDAALGREPDTHSERLAASLAQLARANGLQRIDHVVLGNVEAQGVHNVFAVQGALDDPAHRRVKMPVDQALSSTVEESLQQMAATDRQHAAVIPGPTDVQIVEQAQHPVMG